MKGLSEGQHVDLVLESGSRLTARVESLGENDLVLGLFREPDQRLSGLHGSLEFIDHRGIHRQRGRLESHGRERDAVRLVATDKLELIQRREYVRVDAYTAVDVEFEDRDANAVGTTTVNVSASGLLLAGPSVLEMEEKIKVKLDIGEDEPVLCRGQVVRETQEGFKGIHIIEITEADQDRLVKYIFERQRNARSVGRGGR